ncbi:MAG: ABC transporter ATP-binding protein [Candidatus Spyradocola sp.]
MSFFIARSLTAGYGKIPVIRDVSFALERGCLMGILGANGSGKTTLLKAVCGILPHQGRCTLEGVPLEACTPRQLARLCSYIPQRSGIGIDLSVLDVVLMGFNPRLGLLEHPDRAMHTAALRAIAQAGLAGREHENYLHLSEGQKQLCILARTLVTESRLLLLDEPESALDFRYRYNMLDELRGWIASTQGSALVTLHDPVLALNSCDRLLLLGDGRLLGTLSPRTDSPETMERLLRCVYGPVSLQPCQTRGGNTRLLLLKEDEP